MEKRRLYIELENCIGCRSCLAACTQCGGHEQKNRNYVYDDDDVNPLVNRQTMPLMCLHCVDPACARSCPAQAIQIHETGAVLSALTEKCIGCQNCTIACPYGIPPMCASVCPSNTLQWLTEEEIEAKQQQHDLGNDKWVTSMPYLEGETNVRVNLPRILQGTTKLF
ncbi:4Fe-4S dicluster domain-containing protein [Virgibacillus kekensis]|uniref:4Fe-4S dicluster domain-containing protein n=1 Tax=Virgibacillus kekensis TaxID=202261 RepID=A0ABV9DMH4_9BACI